MNIIQAVEEASDTVMGGTRSIRRRNWPVGKYVGLCEYGIQMLVYGADDLHDYSPSLEDISAQDWEHC